jgi:hypothetical protein
MVAVTTPMPLVVQIVPTRDKGGITKTRGTTVTREVVTMATMEGVEASKGEDTTPMQTKTRVVDPVAGVIDTTPHRETTLPPPPVQVRIKVRTFMLMTWLLSLTTIPII